MTSIDDRRQSPDYRWYMDEPEHSLDPMVAMECIAQLRAKVLAYEKHLAAVLSDAAFFSSPGCAPTNISRVASFKQARRFLAATRAPIQWNESTPLLT